MTDRQKTKRQTRKTNRAQRKAQEVRLAESSVPAPVDFDVAMQQESLVDTTETAPVIAKNRVSRKQSQQPQYVLPREVEYGYIHADLRRLIITAGILLAIMFALLFILD